MPFAQFEEKTFEQFLTHELIGRRTFFFPPGQNLEHSLGFDVALFTRSRRFWKMIGGKRRFFPWWPSGITIDQTWWPNLPSNINYLPSFRFNLFIQYKRPEYLDHSPSAEWNDWKQPYFRYNLDHNQQITLENLAGRILNQALVIYASPAFHTYSELFQHHESRTITDNSNFANAIDLTGHTRYSYTNPGHEGKVHSDAVNVPGRDLFELMNSLLEGRSKRTNEEFLLNLGKNVDSILLENEYLREQYIAFKKQYDVELIDNINDSFLVMSLFTLFTNTLWLVGHE